MRTIFIILEINVILIISGKHYILTTKGVLIPFWLKYITMLTFPEENSEDFLKV